MFYRRVSAFFCTVICVLVFANHSQAADPVDLHALSWFFDKANNIYPAMAIKDQIVILAFKKGLYTAEEITGGHLEFLKFRSIERSDFYRFTDNLPGDRFVSLLDRPEFRVERRQILGQFRNLITDLQGFYDGWSTVLGHSPGWLTTERSLFQLMSKERRAFERLYSFYLAMKPEHVGNKGIDNIAELEFENTKPPSFADGKFISAATIDFMWDGGLFAYLEPRLMRGGRDSRSPEELSSMRLEFIETMREQNLSMDLQLRFLKVLDELIKDSELLHNVDFVSGLLEEMGPKVFEQFNLYYDQYMKDQARGIRQYINQILGPGSPAHALMKKLTEESDCSELLSPPKK